MLSRYFFLLANFSSVASSNEDRWLEKLCVYLRRVTSLMCINFIQRERLAWKVECLFEVGDVIDVHPFLTLKSWARDGLVHLLRISDIYCPNQWNWSISTASVDVDELCLIWRRGGCRVLFLSLSKVAWAAAQTKTLSFTFFSEGLTSSYSLLEGIKAWKKRSDEKRSPFSFVSPPWVSFGRSSIGHLVKFAQAKAVLPVGLTERKHRFDTLATSHWTQTRREDRFIERERILMNCTWWLDALSHKSHNIGLNSPPWPEAARITVKTCKQESPNLSEMECPTF